MSTLFSAWGIQDSDYLFAGTIGNRVIFDAIQTVMDRHNRDMDSLMRLFVEEDTEAAKERYKLPAVGRLQKIGPNGRPSASKVTGGWDVAYPLEGYGDRIISTDVDLAYTTAAEMDKNVMGVVTRNASTVRWEILTALFRSSNVTFVDDKYGSLTVKPIANGDTDVYPQGWASDSQSTADHIIGSNYAASAISDTNNPVKTISDALYGRFGYVTGGGNLAVFYHSDEHAKLSALTAFTDLEQMAVLNAADNEYAAMSRIPELLRGGTWEVTGYCNGAWMCRWNWIPSGYMFGLHLEQPKPLKRRIDVQGTGLRPGLQLIAQDVEMPFYEWFWRNRFGFGVGNRLNGYAIHLNASTSYTDPTVS